MAKTSNIEQLPHQSIRQLVYSMHMAVSSVFMFFGALHYLEHLLNNVALAPIFSLKE